MSEQTTLQSIARSDHRKNFPLICRGAAARRPRLAMQACFRSMIWLSYNHISAAGAISVTLTNAERQARYRQRQLSVDGEKVRVGLNLNAGTRAKVGRLARDRGYTITALVKARVERTERRVTARLPLSRSSARIDSEPMSRSRQFEVAG
jgi:hypothetical protein